MIWDLSWQIFKCIEYSIVNYKHNIVEQISVTFPFRMTEMLYRLDRNSFISFLVLAPGNHHSILCFYVFDYFR